MHLYNNSKKTLDYLIVITLIVSTALILACNSDIPPHLSDMQHNDATDQKESLLQDLSNQNIKQHDIEQHNIDDLKRLTTRFKMDFEKKRIIFYKTLHLNIDFSKIDPKFDTIDAGDKIYAGLGYDIDIVNQMAEIVQKIYDPKHCTPEGKKIIYTIFEGLYHIMDLYEFILYICLNPYNLNHNDAAKNPTIVDTTYKDIITIGNTGMIMMLKTIQMQLSIALSKQNYNDMCSILQSLIETPYGIISMMIHTTGYISIEIENFWGSPKGGTTLIYKSY